MEKIIIPNGEIELLLPENILYINFIGDIGDKDYKHIWETGVAAGVDHNVKKYIFDQSNVGKVSFTTRGWVILKMLPKIKNEIGTDLSIGVISSKSVVSKGGMKYMAGMFEKMMGLKVNFYGSLEDAKAAANS